MFKKIKNLFKTGWFLSLLGLIIVAILIWFVGPLIEIANNAFLAGVVIRLVLIFAMFTSFVLYQLYKAHKANRRNSELVDNLEEETGDTAADALAEEVEGETRTLQTRLDDALDKLKDAKFGEKGDYLYQLPWYAIIGPPAAGKTTALLNSGLSFPLDDHGAGHAVRGAGGTRHCDWWFTDKAVMIDTAGRYTVQDTDQSADSAAWLGFLDILKKRRPRRPLNGVFVAISATDLISSDAATRQSHATAIRNRIEELNARLKISLPIYVIVTKMDLLSGFTEFYENFSLEEREQVWGVTTPADFKASVVDTIGVITEESEELARRLSVRMFDRLNEETDFERRLKIFGFPQQFAGLRRATTAFLRDAFQESRFTMKPFLRGVYFTSGTQEGAPIDRLLGALSSGLTSGGASPDLGLATSKAFFINKLLGEVAFGEAELAGADPKAEKRQRFRHLGAIAAGAGVLVLAMGLWTMSYFRNAGMVARFNDETVLYAEEVTALPTERDALVEVVLPALGQLRDATFSKYAEPKKRRSAGISFGLGQTRRARTRLLAEYDELLQTAFLPRILAGLEKELRANTDQPDLLYENLRVYLMAGGQGPMDTDAVLSWLLDSWRERYRSATDEETRAALLAHAEHMFRQPLPPQSLDEAIVQEARDQLRNLSPARRLFADLENGDEAYSLPVWSALQNAGPVGATFFDVNVEDQIASTVPGLYTREGYDKVARPQMLALAQSTAKTSWVLGDAANERAPIDKDLLHEELEELYFNKFSAEWRALFKSLKIKSQVCGRAEQTRSRRDCLNRQSDNIKTATGGAAPLSKFLVAAAKATDLSPTNEQVESGVIETLELGSSRFRRLRRTQRRFAGESEEAPDPIDIVINQFAELRDLVSAPEGEQTQLETSILQLDRYGDLLARAADEVGNGPSNREALGFGEELTGEIDKFPEPARRLFMSFIQSGSAAVSQQSKQQLNDAFSADVARQCANAISGRYPFSANATEEVRLGDFRKMFGPGGSIDEFFDQNLSQYVDNNGRSWRLAPDGEEISLAAGTPRKFQNADELKQDFFGGGRLGADYTIDSVSLDENAASVTLTLDGAVFKNSHAPTRPVKASWPAEAGAKGVRVVFQRAGGGDAAKSWNGDWAVFRMLQDAEIVSRSSAELVFKITIDGLSAAFRLETDSIDNPFSAIDKIARIRCTGGV